MGAITEILALEGHSIAHLTGCGGYHRRNGGRCTCRQSDASKQYQRMKYALMEAQAQLDTNADVFEALLYDRWIRANLSETSLFTSGAARNGSIDALRLIKPLLKEG